MLRLALALVAVVALGSARAATLEPDVRLPGAEARLGHGGGWWAGGWVELRLTASGPGEYRLRLETEEGSLRSGLVPVAAELAVPDEPGLRVARLSLPMVSRRLARLTLEGPDGRRTVRVAPYPGTPAAVVAERLGAVGGWPEGTVELPAEAIAPDPALWLAAPSLVVRGEGPAPTAVLAMLAAGSRVYPPGGGLPGLEGLEPGRRVGLGRLETAGTGAEGRRVDLDRVALAAAPEVEGPARRAPGLAVWAAVGFLACLGYYSARREEPRALGLAAAGALAMGLVGTWGLSTTRGSAEAARRLVLGAGGWGLETRVVSRVGLPAGPLTLPPGARPLGRVPRRYAAEATRLTLPAWSRLAYYTKPRATTVPLVVANGRVVNRGKEALASVYVVGVGGQEPLPPGASRPLGRPLGGFPPNELAALVETLPEGSAIATLGDTLYLVPPEESR